MTPQPSLQLSAQDTAKLQTRYQDGYRIAKFVNMLGQMVKGVGVLTAIGFFFWVYSNLTRTGYLNPNNPGSNPVMLLVTLVASAVIVFIFWVIGVFIAATGQMLKASMDTAINSSPFLTDAQKLAALS